MIPEAMRASDGAAVPAELAHDRSGRAMPAVTTTGAGNNETIPRTFLAILDLVVLCGAFAAASLVAPWVQWLLLPTGPLSVTLPAWLAVPGSPAPGEFPALAHFAWVLAVSGPVTLIFMELLGGYRQLISQSRSRLVVSSGLAPLISLGFVTLVLFTLKIPDSSRTFIFTYGALSVAGLLTYRSTLRLYKARRLEAGEYAKNVVLVGQVPAVTWMTSHFNRHVPTNRFQLVGWLNVPAPAGRATDRVPYPIATRVPLQQRLVRHETATADLATRGGQEVTDPDTVDLPRLGTVEDLGTLLVSSPIHEVIAIQSSGDRGWLKQVLEDCDYFRVRLRIVPEALLVGTLRDLKLMFRTEPLRLPEVVLAPRQLENDALFLKRLIDIAVSAALLVLLSPLLAIIALAIKRTTPGLPVLYPWRVIGLKGCPFTGYKFTTMVADADQQREELASRNEMQGPVFKLRDDPRVTPLGRWLRKFSLNELPQLWSVLKGDMSLVGPRPAFRHELERYELWHKRKLCVKPGITCLWQVSGRNRISDFDDWVRLDLQYIDEWSLGLDLRILARTAWAVAAGTGS